MSWEVSSFWLTSMLTKYYYESVMFTVQTGRRFSENAT